MDNREEREFTNMLKATDKPVLVDAKSTVQTFSIRRSNRSLVAKTGLVSSLTLVGIVALASIPWISKQSDSPKELAQNETLQTNWQSYSQPFEIIDGLPAEETQLQLDKRLHKLKMELTALNAIQYEQQSILLKEKLSRTEINSPQFSMRGF